MKQKGRDPYMEQLDIDSRTSKIISKSSLSSAKNKIANFTKKHQKMEANIGYLTVLAVGSLSLDLLN